MNRDEALLYIQKYGDKLYDPDLIEDFCLVCSQQMPDITVTQTDVRALETRRLEPGMVLARNLHANNGMLLLNEGKVLTRPLIDKLVAFEAIETAHYTLIVRLPEKQPALTE
jgi:hypothetical protein